MVVPRESGELESDEPIEESSFEELNCLYSPPPTTYSPPWEPANFPDFTPSPTNSPVWGPTSFSPSPPCFPASPPPPSSSTSSRFGVRTGLAMDEEVVGSPLTLFVDYLIEERGGELNVINGLEGGALNVINEVNTSNALEFEGSTLNAVDKAYEDMRASLGDFIELEHQHEYIIDQLVLEHVGVDHRVIGYRGGQLGTISAERVSTINRVEYRQGRALSTTSEPSVEFEGKLSARLWRGDRGQWVVDIRYGWKWLNLGTFRTTEGAPSHAESKTRRRGGNDLFDYPLPFLIENGSEPQEENQDGGIGCEGTGDCAMADQAQFNSECSKKRKTREKNPEGERGNKKAKGVRIEIPLDDILQRKGMCIEDAANDLEVSKSTLKRICREYGIYRWPPRKGQELIGQSRPNKSPVVIDQEQIPQMNPDTLLPSNQVPATSDTYRVKVKGKKVSDMKALKTTEPKESSKSKKRDSSLSAECSKRKVDILKAKHNAKSTSVSVTSQDHGEPQGLLAECIKTLNAMENIDGESYMKAMKLLKDDPSWRPIFLDMSEQRKKDFVSYV